MAVGDEVLAWYSGDSEEISLWDIRDPAVARPLASIPVAESGEVAAVPGTPMLAVEGKDGSVDLWSLADRTAPHTVGRIVDRPVSDYGLYLAAANLGDRRVLVVGRDGLPVTLWDITDPTIPRQLGATPSPVGGPIAITADGRVLATVDRLNGHTVSLWDISKPTTPRQKGQSISLAADVETFTFAASALIVVDLADLTLWTVVEPGRPDLSGVLSVPSRQRTADNNTVVAVAPDGRAIATANSKAVQIWSVDSAGSPRQPGGPVPGGLFMTFADAHSVAVANEKGEVQLWNMADPARPQPVGDPYVDKDFDAANPTSSGIFGLSVAADPAGTCHGD